MAISKEKKATIIDKLDKVVKDSSTLVFVGFKKLPVADTTAMRRELRQKGVGYMVAKKTLMRRVLDGAGIAGDMPSLDGEVALAYGTDQIAPAQSVRAFEKKFKDQVSILGGVFEGAYKDKAMMTDIASIPALPVLRGMFVNVINSPIAGLAIALNAVAEKKS